MTEKYFDKPCWVIDFLPEQVPADSPGQYFPVEAYLLKAPRQQLLRQRWAGLLLRLSCYLDFQVFTPDETESWDNPDPETLVSLITGAGQDLCILLPDEDALITLNREDLYMTVWHPSGSLRKLLEQLAHAEGLFFRRSWSGET